LSWSALRPPIVRESSQKVLNLISKRKKLIGIQATHFSTTQTYQIPKHKEWTKRKKKRRPRNKEREKGRQTDGQTDKHMSFHQIFTFLNGV